MFLGSQLQTANFRIVRVLNGLQHAGIEFVPIQDDFLRMHRLDGLVRHDEFTTIFDMDHKLRRSLAHATDGILATRNKNMETDLNFLSHNVSIQLKKTAFSKGVERTSFNFVFGSNINAAGSNINAALVSAMGHHLLVSDG
jgi:hypothetical protein